VKKARRRVKQKGRRGEWVTGIREKVGKKKVRRSEGEKVSG